MRYRIIRRKKTGQFYTRQDESHLTDIQAQLICAAEKAKGESGFIKLLPERRKKSRCNTGHAHANA